MHSRREFPTRLHRSTQHRDTARACCGLISCGLIEMSRVRQHRPTASALSELPHAPVNIVQAQPLSLSLFYCETRALCATFLQKQRWSEAFGCIGLGVQEQNMVMLALLLHTGLASRRTEVLARPRSAVRPTRDSFASAPLVPESLQYAVSYDSYHCRWRDTVGLLGPALLASMYNTWPG